MSGRHDKSVDADFSSNVLLTGPIVIRGVGRGVKDAFRAARPSRHRAAADQPTTQADGPTSRGEEAVPQTVGDEAGEAAVDEPSGRPDEGTDRPADVVPVADDADDVAIDGTGTDVPVVDDGAAEEVDGDGLRDDEAVAAEEDGLAPEPALELVAEPQEETVAESEDGPVDERLDEPVDELQGESVAELQEEPSERQGEPAEEPQGEPVAESQEESSDESGAFEAAGDEGVAVGEDDVDPVAETEEPVAATGEGPGDPTPDQDASAVSDDVDAEFETEPETEPHDGSESVVAGDAALAEEYPEPVGADGAAADAALDDGSEATDDGVVSETEALVEPDVEGPSAEEPNDDVAGLDGTGAHEVEPADDTDSEEGVLVGDVEPPLDTEDVSAGPASEDAEPVEEAVPSGTEPPEGVGPVDGPAEASDADADDGSRGKSEADAQGSEEDQDERYPDEEPVEQQTAAEIGPSDADGAIETSDPDEANEAGSADADPLDLDALTDESGDPAPEDRSEDVAEDALPGADARAQVAPAPAEPAEPTPSDLGDATAELDGERDEVLAEPGGSTQSDEGGASADLDDDHEDVQDDEHGAETAHLESTEVVEPADADGSALLEPDAQDLGPGQERGADADADEPEPAHDDLGSDETDDLTNVDPDETGSPAEVGADDTDPDPVDGAAAESAIDGAASAAAGPDLTVPAAGDPSGLDDEAASLDHPGIEDEGHEPAAADESVDPGSAEVEDDDEPREGVTVDDATPADLREAGSGSGSDQEFESAEGVPVPSDEDQAVDGVLVHGAPDDEQADRADPDEDADTDEQAVEDADTDTDEEADPDDVEADRAAAEEAAEIVGGLDGNEEASPSTLGGGAAASDESSESQPDDDGSGADQPEPEEDTQEPVTSGFVFASAADYFAAERAPRSDQVRAADGSAGSDAAEVVSVDAPVEERGQDSGGGFADEAVGASTLTEHSTSDSDATVPDDDVLDSADPDRDEPDGDDPHLEDRLGDSDDVASASAESDDADLTEPAAVDADEHADDPSRVEAEESRRAAAPVPPPPLPPTTRTTTAPRAPRPVGRPRVRDRVGREALGIVVLAVLAIVCAGLITAVVLKTQHDAALAAREAADYTPPPLSSPTPSPSGPTVAVIGDGTVTQAASGVTAAERWTALLGKSLKGTISTIASPGAGYATKPSSGQTFVQAAGKVPADADVVVIVGGAADADVSALSVAKAATDTISDVKQQAPKAKVVLVGPVIAAGDSAADLGAIRGALRQSAKIGSATWIDPIADGWLSTTKQAASSATALTAADQRTIESKLRSVVVKAAG